MTFSFYTEMLGPPPLRLQEPIASLQLTPFALKAVRAAGVKTVGELSSLVFERQQANLHLGQGHLDEISSKITQFVGRPPYPADQQIDLLSIVRVSLAEADPQDRATVYTFLGLGPLFTLSQREAREAETSLLRDRQKQFFNSLNRLQTVYSSAVPPIISSIFFRQLRPWIVQKGGVVHEQELHAFLFEKGALGHYSDFLELLHLFSLLSGQPCLFSAHLLQVGHGLLAASREARAWALALLNDAQLLKGLVPGQLNSLASAVSRCRFLAWEPCSVPRISDILFWSFQGQ